MALKNKENLPATQTERQGAIVQTSQSSDVFAEYARDRERWLSTPLAHNQTLARCGAIFTVEAAIEGYMPATSLDLQRDKSLTLGDDIAKIKYLCKSQMDWAHEDPMDPKNDQEYKTGEAFLILLSPNAIRRADLERIQDLLREGPIYNVCLQEFRTKKPGMSPSVGLVAAQDWKTLREQSAEE